MNESEIFYAVCKDAVEELKSKGGTLSYDAFFDILKSLKEKYSFDGENSLNPVWWALSKTGAVVYDSNFKHTGNSPSLVTSGTPIDGSFREKTAEYAEEFGKRT